MWRGVWKLCKLGGQETAPYATWTLMNTSDSNVSATFHDPVFLCSLRRLKRNLCLSTLPGCLRATAAEGKKKKKAIEMNDFKLQLTMKHVQIPQTPQGVIFLTAFNLFYFFPNAAVCSNRKQMWGWNTLTYRHIGRCYLIWFQWPRSYFIIEQCFSVIKGILTSQSSVSNNDCMLL